MAPRPRFGPVMQAAKFESCSTSRPPGRWASTGRWASRPPPMKSSHNPAMQIRVNVSTFFQSLTPPTALGLLALSARRASPVGQRGARRSQKDGLPSSRAGWLVSMVQGHRLAREGQPSRCPFRMGGGNGRQDARVPPPRFRLQKKAFSPAVCVRRIDRQRQSNSGLRASGAG